MSLEIQLNPLHVVIGEIQTLVACMRLNSRWATRSSLTAHAPLLQAFKDLRVTLESTERLNAVSPTVYLKPFLDVIQSDETSGPITGVALASLQKVRPPRAPLPIHNRERRRGRREEEERKGTKNCFFFLFFSRFFLQLTTLPSRFSLCRRS
jgi:hypothetical protein